VLYELRRMTREVANKLNKEGYYTKTITITLRNTDFKTITRSKSINEYIDDYNSIYDVVVDLVEEHYHDESLRLIGVGVSNLVTKKELPKEYNLFTINDIDIKEQKIEEMIKDFQEKYGKKALFRKNDKN